MKTTVVYKKTNLFQIEADFYPSKRESAPVIVFIHGGGLVWGSKEDLKKEQIEFYLGAGFNIFSINYRLAPETKLPEIITDIEHAIYWLKHEGVDHFNYDPEKIAVIGGSAGGYLALLSGTFETKPNCIVSFYGYGDIHGDWAHKPSPHYEKMTKVPKELADMLVTNKVITDGPIQKRYAIYMYGRQSANWIQSISGLHRSDLFAYCPLHNITSSFPATLLLHGTLDEDVPYEQSVLMSEALTKANIPTELITIENSKHVFDEDWNNPTVQQAFTRVIEFLNRHL